MLYPYVDPKLEHERHRRAYTELIPGDIVEGWLDCTPEPDDPPDLRPLLVVRGIAGGYVTCSELFSYDVFPVNFTYEWRKLGHIDQYEG